MSSKLHAQSSGVAHHLPHRTRLRVPKRHRTAHQMNRVHEALKNVKGVSQVEVNHKTGSILLHHDEDAGILDVVGKTLDEVSSELFEAMVAGEEAEISGLSIIGHFAHNLFSAADDHLAGATKNMIDLKLVIPIVFLGAGVMRARSSEGSWLTGVSPLILFTYAFDMFWKLHGGHHGADAVPPRRRRLTAG